MELKGSLVGNKNRILLWLALRPGFKLMNGNFSVN